MATPQERKIIRPQVKSILDNASVAWNGNPVLTYMNRWQPFWKADLPLISLYMVNETADHMETAPRYYKRILQLMIEIIVRENTTDTTDDVIDIIADQVEQALFLDPTINDKANDSWLVSTGIKGDQDGDIAYVAASMLWNIEYDTDAPRLQSMDDFITANTDIGINGAISPDSAIGAITTIT